MMSTQELLALHDYKLIDDAWNDQGRCTYLHEDDATREYVANFARVVGGIGWEIDRSKLRSLHHRATGEIIEIEPGGSETTGHFLHHMKSSTS
jgi:hypothetical protein